MKTAKQIEAFVQKRPRGKPFTTSSLVKFGARAAVDQAIARLVTRGKVVRLTRGVYVRPEKDALKNTVLPAAEKVAKTIAERTQDLVQMDGAEAAKQFGINADLSNTPIFLTTGRARKFNLGGLEVTLKHVSKKKIPMPNSKIGIAILALWYMGKHLTTNKIIEMIEKNLTPKEFEELLSSTDQMPIWMSRAITQYYKTTAKAAV